MSPDYQVWLWTFGGKLFDDATRSRSQRGRRARAVLHGRSWRGSDRRKDVDRPDARRLFAQFQTASTTTHRWRAASRATTPGQGAAFDANVGAMATPVAPRRRRTAVACVGAPAGPARSRASGTLNGRSRPRSSPRTWRSTTRRSSPTSRTSGCSRSPTTRSRRWLRPVRRELDAQRRTRRRDETSTWPNAADLTTIVGEEVQGALLVRSPRRRRSTPWRTGCDRATANQRRGRNGGMALRGAACRARGGLMARQRASACCSPCRRSSCSRA